VCCFVVIQARNPIDVSSVFVIASCSSILGGFLGGRITADAIKPCVGPQVFDAAAALNKRISRVLVVFMGN
jgi:hypothetical protein